MGAFHSMTGPVRHEYFSQYQRKDLVYVSQMSSENGPHSNVIKIFPLDRSEAQMFCISFNNLTVLTGLAMLRKAPYIWVFLFYSNLFGIVQQTAKSSKIVVPIFQFGAANAVPKFQLGAANAMPNFQFVVVAISGKISPFCHRFYSGCKI